MQVPGGLFAGSVLESSDTPQQSVSSLPRITFLLLFAFRSLFRVEVQGR
jgi:hypothetical protein